MRFICVFFITVSIITNAWTDAEHSPDLIEQIVFRLKQRQESIPALEYSIEQIQTRTEYATRYLRETYPSKLGYADQDRIDQKVHLKMIYHHEKQYIEEVDYLPEGEDVAGKSLRRWNGSVESVFYPDKKHGTVSQSKSNLIQETLDPFYTTLMNKELYKWLEDNAQTAIISFSEDQVIIEFTAWKNYIAKYIFDARYEYLPVSYNISDKHGNVINKGSVDKVDAIEGLYGAVYMPMEYSSISYIPIHEGASTEFIPAVETRSIITGVKVLKEVDDSIFDPHFPPDTDVYDYIIGESVSKLKFPATLKLDDDVNLDRKENEYQKAETSHIPHDENVDAIANLANQIRGMNKIKDNNPEIKKKHRVKYILFIVTFISLVIVGVISFLIYGRKRAADVK
ncbi:hypothetical protein JXA32_02870 [Candidatus Sumerlaeota bacterium]|nr:hypothetical protein [Candidatus Sumerlaeota bacterium]